MNQDLEHLRLLSIFHYVWAALAALGGCFPMIHLAVGIFFLISPPESPADASPFPAEFMGGIFVAVSSVFIFTMWTVAILNLISARSLKTRSRYALSIVTAGLNCMFAPMGTILGIFTLVVLLRSSTKDLYALDG